MTEQPRAPPDRRRDVLRLSTHALHSAGAEPIERRAAGEAPPPADNQDRTAHLAAGRHPAEEELQVRQTAQRLLADPPIEWISIERFTLNTGTVWGGPANGALLIASSIKVWRHPVRTHAERRSGPGSSPVRTSPARRPLRRPRCPPRQRTSGLRPILRMPLSAPEAPSPSDRLARHRTMHPTMTRYGGTDPQAGPGRAHHRTNRHIVPRVAPWPPRWPRLRGTRACATTRVLGLVQAG